MAEIMDGDLKKFVFTVSEYKGRYYINLRTWVRYDPRDKKDWKPTRKGIAIPMNLAEDFIKAIKQFLIELENYQKGIRKNEEEKKKSTAKKD